MIRFKKVGAILLIFVMAISLVNNIEIIKIKAASNLTLIDLQNKYPAGAYWNHAGSNTNNPDGYTWTPCTHHQNSCGKNGYTGWCGCNSFYSSIQCMGFANKVGYDAYGSVPATWSKTNLANLKAGDVIRYKNNRHSIFVTAVNGNTITYGDCNSDNHCKIRWNQTISKATVQATLTAVYSAPSELRTTTTAPTNPSISKSQIWYDLGDTIQISAHADGATSYFMSIFKDGNKIISQGVDGGTFSMNANAYGVGNYSAYFSCSNSAGTVDTQWIDFNVVGAATYTDVHASNWWYDLSDTVSISVDSICAKGQVIGIDKEGVGRVVTESTDSTFNIAASKLGVGTYSAYFSVYNGSGGIDTKRVSFEIVDSPKAGAIVSTSKTSYTMDDEVEISVLAYCSKNQLVGIDKEGVGRVITENANNGVYKISASKLGKGKYSAYFSVWNNSGGYDTARVEFAIDNELKNPQISISKEKYELNDDIEILASADGGPDYYIAKIYDDKGAEVVNESFTGHKLSVNASKLGKGVYTVKVVCVNSAFSKETKTVTFEIGCSHKYVSKMTKEPTCDKSGIKTYTCSLCGDEYVESIEALGHKYKDTVINPTEDEKGYTLHQCTVCNYSYKSNFTDKVEHSYILIDEKNPSCTADGYKKYKCSDCGSEYTDEVSALGHKYVELIIAPTCTEKGYTLHTCSICGENYKDKYVNEKGHNYVSEITKDADCTSDGLITNICSECNDKKTTIIPAKGHNYEDTIVAPTCDNNGYTLHKCRECGFSYKDREIEKLAHNYKSNITKEATCTSEGIREYVCEFCGNSYTQSIAKKEHTYVSTIKTQASCIDNGVMQYKCSECGDEYDSIIPATGHAYTENVIRPTLTERGFTIHLCKICGDCFIDNYTDSLQKTTDQPSDSEKKDNSRKNFKIKLKAPKIKSVVSKKKSLKVKWNKVVGITGYQIQYSTNKSFKKAKKLVVKGKTKMVGTIRNLKSKKRYYVRVRSYKILKMKTVYSRWSNVKNKKTK